MLAGPVEFANLAVELANPSGDLFTLGIPASVLRFDPFELLVGLGELPIEVGHVACHVLAVLRHLAFQVLRPFRQFGAYVVCPLDFLGELVDSLFRFFPSFFS